MKQLLLKLIKFYQKKISLNTRSNCKYFPTCSNYGYEAIMRFGAFKGGIMTLWRILRCNPFSKGGFDPVPEKKPNRIKKRGKLK